MDWPNWHGCSKSYETFKVYVRDAVGRKVAGEWCSAVRWRGGSIPYDVFEPMPGLSLCRWKGASLTPGIHMMIRSWCRLRCGLLFLSHTRGQRRSYKYQDCIWCGQSTRNEMVHCLSSCPRWHGWRAVLEGHLGIVAAGGFQLFARSCLASAVPQTVFESMVSWAAEIDREECQFWCQQS